MINEWLWTIRNDSRMKDGWKWKIISTYITFWSPRHPSHFSTVVCSWSMKKRINCKLTLDALRQALLRRIPGKELIFHSDQSVQYASAKFRNTLKELKITQSTSGKGNCCDNAVAESFFHTLKNELVYFETYKTRDDAKLSIFDYIEVFYNRKRLHSTLGYLAPLVFEINNKLT